ncbi:hypothetical protein H4V97_000274 [Flavobacterium sp. CG_23.5]|uniref:hypothetical protein n=1 Tax=Flavobacterium sp. CG_23.5 TaxID=2760708 RepID=UPI001AE6C4F3|nr:hypothetical protein [Flavobacterium sp. CG_23.5]MBP2281956.1 hypothetical protein [Flavobacterium sp. CG_23.5]
MNDTRTLIEENAQLGQEIARDLIQYKPALADLKRAYEAMELGLFSNEIFKTLILTGPSNTVAFYITTLNDQLDRLGITSSTMRLNTITGHDKIIEDLSLAVTAAKAFRPITYSRSAELSLKFISFDEGIFIVSDEDYDAILESFCRTYITEDEKPFLELAKELMTSYNKFLDVIDQQNIVTNSRLSCLGLIFSEDSSRKVCIDAGKLKGLITYKQRFELNRDI